MQIHLYSGELDMSDEQIPYASYVETHTCPAKPYYESMDGVGYLLYALLELDQIVVGIGEQKTVMDMDDW